MRLRLTIITALVLMCAGFLPESKTKATRLVSCHDKVLSVIDGAETFRVGACSGDAWVFPLKLKHSIYKGGEPSPKAIELLTLLQALPAESFKPKPFEGTVPTKAMNESAAAEVVVISPDKLPDHIRAFFLRAEADPPSMVFVISSGVRTVGYDKAGVYVNEYKEYYRHIVRVKGNNPTIGEILAEVKALTFDPSITRHPEYLSLMHPASQEVLDNEKTAAAYNLKNGAVLWLISSVR